MMDVFAGLEHVVRDHEPLAPYTWFRLGGAAEYFAEPTSEEELLTLLRRCQENDVAVRLLGGGSNVLVPDGTLPGVVLHLSAPAFSAIAVDGQTVTAGGGAKLGHVVSTTVREGLAGFEQLVGIPGSVGGALHHNAGTAGGDIGQWTTAARVVTRSGEVIARKREDLHFAYRKSSLDELVILDATFELEREDPQQLTKRLQTLWIVKKSEQPKGGLPTGAIFKDPDGVGAASLIEQLGLKGTKVGEAEISPDHANFIIANPGATSGDIVNLIELVEQRVSEQLGVELERGIEIW